MADPAPLEQYTINDHRQWEGDWELIRGIPHAMPPSPGFDHQRASLRIARQLDEA
ncbi:MAG TPA: Uma2 family endonuclease, partial [Desulfobulbaceae bacterium]|nr:Uma2 family endonuclease [Desulfobulbaceae bacterium]